VFIAISHIHRVSKNCSNLFVQSTNFDNCWQRDGKEAKIIQDALISHLT